MTRAIRNSAQKDESTSRDKDGLQTSTSHALSEHVCRFRISDVRTTVLLSGMTSA
jgi:hypothetical protein